MPDIHPINLNPGQFRVPSVDFSWLANLPQTFQQGQANQLKIDEAGRRQTGLAELGKLDPNDPLFSQKAAKIALGLGDLGAASSLLEHGLKRQSQADFLKTYGPGAPQADPAPAPTVAPQAPAQAPTAAPAPSLVAPGVPGLGTTPGSVPTLARPPTVTSAIQQPPTTQVPPVMAQTGAPGSNFTGFTTASGRPKVSFAGVNPDLMQNLNAVGNKLGKPLEVTSARDSTHTTGSQHYVGNAVDIRNRNMSFGERQRVVAELRAQGFNAVDEGDHIHASLPRGTPGQPGMPGTVTASLQGRGPISTGYGGGAIASASPGVLDMPMARTKVAALDPSFAPQTSMTDAGPQLPAGVSPAASAAQGAAGPPMQLPNPTPLVPPNISLAALGALPGGGVGTIGPMGGTAADAMPPQGVQMAQAAQGATGPYQPPFQVPPMQQAAPTLPARPPVQQAPVQAPAPPQAVARGALPGGPLSGYSDRQLQGMAMHPGAPDGARQMAIAELNRRAQVATEANKMPADWQTYLRAKEAGFQGDYIAFKQAEKADTTLARNYAAIVKDREARGLGPPEGGFEKFVADNKPGTVVNVDTIQQKADAAQAAQIAKDDAESFKNYIRAGQAARTKVGTFGVLEAMMNSPGFYSGTAATSVTWLKQMRDALGWKEGDAPNAGPNEVFRAYSNKVITDELGGLGAGVSNADVQFLSQIAPSLNHSAPGNRMLIAIGRAMAARAEKLSEMARAYKKANGGKFDSGFEDVAADYAAKNPIITQEQLEQAARGDIPASRRDLLDKMKRYE